MPLASTPLPEAVALVTLRIFLFLGCRQYLLRSLYSDLQTLSAGPAADVLGLSHSHSPIPMSASIANDSHDIELSDLPTPATHSLKPPPSTATRPTSSALHSSIARTVFSLVFVESSMMFFVLMLQGLGRFSSVTRFASWKFSLTSLMGIILLVVPLSISLVLAIGSKSAPVAPKSLRSRLVPRLIFSLVLIGFYIFFLSKIPLPPALKAPDTFTAALARLVVLGTIFLGVLSGYGAVSNAWGYLPFMSRSGSVATDHEITTAEHSLQSVRNDLRDRKEAAERRANSSATEGTWISRIVPGFRGEDSNAQELRGLEALEYQMSRNLESLRIQRDAARYARTFRGRLVGVAGRVFAVYCVVRIASSIINLVFPSRYAGVPSPESPAATTVGRTADLVADLLARVLKPVFKGSKAEMMQLDAENVASFARQLSLGMVGVIILTSVRRVLSGVTRALRITSRNMGASFMMLFLAQLMGIYLLSTIVQLRNSFPPPPPESETMGGGNAAAVHNNLFTTIPEFEVFGPLFDWSFLLAAGVSAGTRWGMERVSG